MMMINRAEVKRTDISPGGRVRDEVLDEGLERRGELLELLLVVRCFAEQLHKPSDLKSRIEVVDDDFLQNIFF